MAKVPYIGVDGVARKCKSLYIGVDGVARKVKSGYIGVNGVAKQFFSSAMPKPDGEAYLTFISPEVFSIAIGNANKNWDGTLEYFTVDGTWAEWDGSSSIQAKNGDDGYVLYFRGTGNTKITGIAGSSNKWVITGEDVRCSGNIETLLDYATVESGEHPDMSSYCYSQMFTGCSSLTHAPALPATTLSMQCYTYMFHTCSNLTQIPALPATTLSANCYLYMFYGCTKIKLSETKTGEYTVEYRIPTSGTGTAQSNSLNGMFMKTGGTFTGKPSINTTYYLSSSNTIV